MLKRIYFGNKPLFLSDSQTNEELQPYLDDSQTVILNNLNSPELLSLISKIQTNEIKAGIIINNVTEAVEAIKKEFTVIQASGGLVHSPDNKILLIFRRGKWDLPKGKLDDGENLVNCALREVKEETGLSDLLFEQFICITYHTYHQAEKHILKESHWHLLKGNNKEILIPQTDEDIEKCEWVKIDKLDPYIENAPASVIDVLTEGIRILNTNK